MESDSFLPSKQADHDESPIICPEFSIWDVGVDHFSYLDSPKVEGMINLGNNGKNKQPEKLQDIGETANHQEVQKKIVHREIEKQRRKEMATLYSSLRSVLPPQSIKGKRSTSDQIHEATKYIRYLQNNIRQLEIKRDNIKKWRKNELLDSEKGSSSKNSPIIVTIQPCSDGIEILISGDDFMGEGPNLPLSKILQLLLEEGLNVIDYNCTKFDGSLHYIIRCQVLTYPSVNLQMLQTKLVSMINTLVDVKQ